ncbi:MAG: lysozyme [Candidatus Kapabacteria bacterium]|nr:lysozyme [Candidatus Kapabacteria bacterium]
MKLKYLTFDVNFATIAILIGLAWLLFLCHMACGAEVRISDQGRKILIENFEGCQKYLGNDKYTTYLCPAKVKTIGFGNCSHAKTGLVIDKATCRVYLMEDCAKFEKYVGSIISRKMQWHEADALVSFSFNLGKRITGDLRQYIETGKTQAVKAKINLYCRAKVNGVLTELRGLKRRRTAEANWYEKGDTNQNSLLEKRGRGDL